MSKVLCGIGAAVAIIGMFVATFALCYGLGLLACTIYWPWIFEPGPVDYVLAGLMIHAGGAMGVGLCVLLYQAWVLLYDGCREYWEAR
jgi:hypothetical protein